MYRRITLVLLAAILVGILGSPTIARGNANFPIENCRSGAFSTEEDFMMQQGEPYDGNPYISDGDLLSPTGQVCARNADLLLGFQPAGVAAIDLGLDAADVFLAERIVAFSTELDDPFRNAYTAGDLMFTGGGIIPNQALVLQFGIRHDIGLDAVQFVGDRDQIGPFINRVREADPAGWEQGLLQQLLEAFGLDIWFSIEGTHWLPDQPPILDGDLLSAGQGMIVIPNSGLLPNSVPAGLVQRGVDFGLDAVTTPFAREPENARKEIRFSTEILFRGEPLFTDGDVLRVGNGVEIPNEALIAGFHPAADFLGLDALATPIGDEPPPVDPNIQLMCGDRAAAHFDGGMVPVGGSGTGLYRENPNAMWPDGRPRQPCGNFVPINGFLPNTGVDRFRVAYRPDGAAGPVQGIQTTWRLYEWRWWPISGCYADGASPTLSTDGNGWMDASDYVDARDGTMTGCINPGLQMAVWNTAGVAGFDPGPADPNGHYVLWLEWVDNVATPHREPWDHHLQLDNTLPVINDLEVTLADGSTVVGACGEAPAGENIFKINADFEDDYYWSYLLRVRGGDPPAGKTYGWHNYYDGTAEVTNTDRTGTTPDNTTVFLRDIDMTDLGASFTDCCYVLDLWVRDAAIRHSFNRKFANENTGSSIWHDNAFLTFAAAP